MISPKEAFKLGFCLKLAEAGVMPEQLLPLLEKDGSAGVALGGALLGSIALPTALGRVAGEQAMGLMDDEADTFGEARKTYMLKRYRDLIARREAELAGRAVAQAKREVR